MVNTCFHFDGLLDFQLVTLGTDGSEELVGVGGGKGLGEGVNVVTEEDGGVAASGKDEVGGPGSGRDGLERDSLHNESLVVDDVTKGDGVIEDGGRGQTGVGDGGGQGEQGVLRNVEGSGGAVNVRRSRYYCRACSSYHYPGTRDCIGRWM